MKTSAADDARGDRLDVGVGGWRQRMEGDGAVGMLLPDTVGDQRVEAEVGVEEGAEALHRGHGSTSSARASPFRSSPTSSTCSPRLATPRIARPAQDHLAGEIGAPRAIANALEGLDLCVAQKAALGPEVDAWLKAKKK